MSIAPLRTWPFVLFSVAVITALAGCTGATAPPPALSDEDRALPTSMPSLPPVFYVDPTSPANEQVARWEAEGRVEDAALLRRISERPTAKWPTGDQSTVREQVAAFVTKAAIAGQMPVLVAHNIPERDCGRSTTGGARTAQAYQHWIREFAAGIAGRPVTVIVEPNAVADAVAGCVKKTDVRYALLRDAVNVLKSTGSARVYLDAGHPQWIKDLDELTHGLKRAGIELADGFSLNVANFFRVEDNVEYGHRISDALGGNVSFVIDTSRNGNGPYPDETVRGAPSWCNPPGRALGPEPTDRTGLDRVDALLWIKYPGESDGACRPGEPKIGHWWPEYALELARRSSAAAQG
ncbi:MAG TPA: glycoside hydrolase family 6 protein [Micromonosporaceae bacterium]